MTNLSNQQRQAVEAFQGGYISLGKLAEELGMNIWNTRKWLMEHDIPQNDSFFEDGVKNAWTPIWIANRMTVASGSRIKFPLSFNPQA